MNKTFGTMIATEDFIPGAKMLHDSLVKVNAKYDFILLVANTISEEQVRAAGFTNNKIYFFDLLNADDTEPSRERYTINKIHALNIIPNNMKLCLIDADIKVVKNIDHYLDFPYMSGYVATYDDNKLNGGIIIFEHNEDDFIKAKKLAKHCYNDEHIWGEMFPKFAIEHEKHLPLDDWKGNKKQCRIIHYGGYPKPWMDGENEG